MNSGYPNPSQIVPLFFKINRQARIRWTITQDSATPNTTGWTWQLFVKQFAGARLNVINLTLGNGLRYEVYSDTILIADFSSVQTNLEEGEYYYELVRTDIETTWIEGAAHFEFSKTSTSTVEESNFTVNVDSNGSPVTIAVASSQTINVNGLTQAEATALYLLKSANLSDLASAATARANLGNVDTQNSGATTAAVSGTDTYTATLTPALTAYVTGQTFKLTGVTANTVTNPTINFNGLGAKNLLDYKGAALTTGVFAGAVIVTYDGTSFRMIGGGSSATEATFSEALTGTGSAQMMSPRRVRQVAAKVFNVEGYGAVHDGVTDDTAAIQSAINACYTAGGGVIYFPNGVYIIAGALITSLDGVNPNCQIYIPLHNKLTNHSTIPTIHFLGESLPAPFGTMLNNTGGVEPPVTGVVLFSTITGSGSNPRVIGSSYYNTGFTDTNSLLVLFENIRIRVKSKSGASHIAPVMGAFGAKYIECARFLNCIADTESASWDSVEPTSSGCVGFDTPQLSNRANSSLEYCYAQNYHTGFALNEHLYVSDLIAQTCVYCYLFKDCNHEIYAAKLQANGYKYAFVYEDGSRSTVAIGYTERYNSLNGTKWYNGTAEMYAPSALASGTYGRINLHVLNSGNSTAVKPVYSGTFGGFIRVEHIPNAPKYSGSSGTFSNIDYPVVQIRNLWETVSGDTYMPDLLFINKQTGTANLIGRVQFINESSADADKRLGQISVKTNAATDAGLMIIAVNSGSALVETTEFRPTRTVSAVPFQVPSYTVAGVPAASSGAGQIIYVSNESGGAVLAFSDATNWRRVTDRAIIS